MSHNTLIPIETALGYTLHIICVANFIIWEKHNTTTKCAVDAPVNI